MTFYKSIPGHPMYEAGDDGSIRSWVRGTPHILKPGRSTPYGHLTVVLRRRNTQSVHVLVAATFLGPRPPGADTRHKDGNPSNNSIANLEYGTRAQNCRDVLLHKRRKLTLEQAAEIRAALSAGAKQLDLAALYSVNPGTIAHIKSGKQYRDVLV